MKRQTADRIVGIISRVSILMILAAVIVAAIFGPEESPWPYFIAAAAFLLMVVGITINFRYNIEEK